VAQIPGLATRVPPLPVAIAYGATITPNCDASDTFNVGTLTGSPTFASPSGTAQDGKQMQFRFAQDGTGGRVITWNAIYAFGTDITAAMVPTAANAKWEMLFRYHAGDTKWRCIAIVRGF
jgi:hypothetical protein